MPHLWSVLAWAQNKIKEVIMKYLAASDLHLTAEIPRCRVDDYITVQAKTIETIYDIAEREEATVILAGDIFDKARPIKQSQELEIFLIEQVRRAPTLMIAGQHDLLYHDIKNLGKGSYGVVLKALNCEVPEEIALFNFDEEIKNIPGKRIAVLHKFTAQKTVPPFMDGITARELLDNFDYDLFICGDNHAGFVYEGENNRYVLNCGSVMRRTSDKIDYQPKCYLYDTDRETLKSFDLPDTDPEAIDITYLEERQKRDDRIENFVKKLTGDVNLSMSFSENLEIHIKENEVNAKIAEKIYQALEV